MRCRDGQHYWPTDEACACGASRRLIYTEWQNPRQLWIWFGRKHVDDPLRLIAVFFHGWSGIRRLAPNEWALGFVKVAWWF